MKSASINEAWAILSNEILFQEVKEEYLRSKDDVSPSLMQKLYFKERELAIRAKEIQSMEKNILMARKK